MIPRFANSSFVWRRLRKSLHENTQMLEVILAFHSLCKIEKSSREIRELSHERACRRREADLAEKLSQLHHQTNESLAEAEGDIKKCVLNFDHFLNNDFSRFVKWKMEQWDDI